MDCDSNGIIRMLQKLTYEYSDMSFEAELFNGETLYFSSDCACPSIGLMDILPTTMQMLEAENTITKHLESRWTDYF